MSENKNKNNRWWLELVTIFFITILVLVAFFWSYQTFYESRVYPGIKIGSLSLGAKTVPEAYQILQARIDKINQEGFKFVYEDEAVVVMPIIVSSNDPDFFYKIIDFDLENILASAYNVGRDQNIFINTFRQMETLIFGTLGKLSFQLDQEELIAILEDHFNIYEIPAKDAALVMGKEGQLEVIPEQLGRAFNWAEALDYLRGQLVNLEPQTIKLSLITDYPEIYIGDTQGALEVAREIFDLAPLTLEYGEENWEIDQKELGDWLQFERTESTEIEISLNQEKVEKFLAQIAEGINISAKEAKFEIVEGKVLEFQTSANGLELSLEKTFRELKQKIILERETTIGLIVEEVKSKLTNKEVNNLGIVELIGMGESNFAWSPKNRRHNIKVGAEALNGLLIPPDTEFSLGEALGEIDGEHGYLPEMVIKGNKTIPEYGGGLCQIATTIFRAAMGTGLPITERHPHTYRVSYYEPAGTDAAIYTPYVDVKFINDTGYHILIQTEIDGDKLTFYFYGTSDGRVAEQTTPKIYNYVSPPETKIIETEDLAPGEKKCTERAHTGADTEFTYTINYPDGEIMEKTFYTHYQPWQEVCLVGVEPKKNEEKEKILKDEEKLEEIKIEEKE